MFCPLCQASYREGFTQCSDCHLELVATSRDAEHAAVRLWNGEKQGVLDSVLDALAVQNIPSHYKESAKLGLPGWGILLGYVVKTKFHYEVWVLRKDLESARSAVARIAKG